MNESTDDRIQKLVEQLSDKIDNIKASQDSLASQLSDIKASQDSLVRRIDKFETLEDRFAWLESSMQMARLRQNTAIPSNVSRSPGGYALLEPRDVWRRQRPYNR